MGTLLHVEDLRVGYESKTAVHGASFSVGEGEIVALIGQSGSGKTTIAKAILGLLRGAPELTGEIRFEDQQLLELSGSALRSLLGRRIGFVPQDPTSSLNPVRTIGAQALEALARAELDVSDAEHARELVREAFEEVGLPEPERIFGSYPHQLSGGQLQRVLIALAVLPRPALLVADEPTSALDVTVQRLILDVLVKLRDSSGTSILLITHDLAVAGERADALIVLNEGHIQETGAAQDVFHSPQAEYTRKLLTDVPGLNPGRFGSHRAAREAGAVEDRPIVEFKDVGKTFSSRRRTVQALQNLSFSLPRGTTHALVGESGSGKSTAARLLLGLDSPDAGEVLLHGERISDLGRRELKRVRRHLQLVYQNPFTSLDPSMTVLQMVEEPLKLFRASVKEKRRQRVAEVLSSLGLDQSFLSRRPAQLSGGQRQRVAIARALVLEPEVLVLDEPTSALDVSVQSEILELLFRLQVELGLSYLFVSHDLGVVRQLADTVTVLRRGINVESGPVERIFTDPEDPYTQKLISSIPGTRSPMTVTPSRVISPTL